MSDLPDLTRLELKTHDISPDRRTLTVSFLVNVQQTLLEDFEGAAVDAALKHAHARGYLPVGPMLVRTEPAEYDPPKLKEGVPMHRSIDDLQLDMAIQAGNIVQVICDVELGPSLL